MTKQRVLRMVWALAAAALLVLASCNELPGQGKKGGTFVLGLVAEPTSLDPAQLTDINSMRILSSVYDTLVRFDEGGFELKPALATKWTVSSDGLTYTFELRKNVKFHDGTPFNAAAVKFNFDRMLDPKHEFASTGPFPFAGFYYGSVKETKVTDDSTVQIILKTPYSPLLNSLTLNQGRIVSPDAVKKYGKDYGQHAVGTGPFKLVEWQHGVRVVVERNNDYWDGAPLLDKIVFRPIPDEQTRFTELKSGNADAIVDVPPDNVAQVKSDNRYQYIEQPGPHIWWATFNLDKKPFSDLKVRQAVMYATNRDAISRDILKGTGTTANGPIPPSIKWAYTDDVTKYPYDPNKAKQLLADAGYPNGFSAVFWVPESGSGMQSPKSMATAIQGDLAKVGVKTQLQTTEWAVYLDKRKNGQMPLYMLGWTGDNGDPDNFLCYFFCQPGAAREGFYANKPLADVLLRAQKLTQQSERAKLYRQAEQLLRDDVGRLFVANNQPPLAFAKRVKGYVPHPTGSEYFNTVEMQ